MDARVSSVRQNAEPVDFGVLPKYGWGAMETNAPTFTRDDISAASGLNQTQIENLVRLGLAPESEGKGRGSARRYDTDALAHFAVIGAVFDAGVDLVSAARLMVAINETIVADYDGMHDNLDAVYRRLGGQIPWLHDVPYNRKTDRFDRFALFVALRQNMPDVDLCEAHLGDLLIEVINRTYVFSGVYSNGANNIKTFNPFGADSDVQAEFRLMGWERGSAETRIEPVSHELPYLGDDAESHNAYMQAGHAVTDEYNKARRNAVSFLRFNVSCAIRRGFEAVFQKRNQVSPEIAD